MSVIARSSLGAWLIVIALPALGQHTDHAEHASDPVERDETSEHNPHASHAQHRDHVHHGQRVEQTESQLRHVPPPPPERPLPDMSNERMIELMDMSDTAPVPALIVDQLEARFDDGEDVVAWDADAWFGNDYTKAWFKTEGEATEAQDASRHELLMDRVIDAWWSVQAGVRHDLLTGPSRTWAAMGVRGVTPFGYELEATVYAGEAGRTALRAALQGEWLLTQRLILEPELEIDVRGKDDVRNALGSGLSSTEVGLRLRYEIRRELAPYIGLQWSAAHGETADLMRDRGEDRSELRAVAGLRVWM